MLQGIWNHAPMGYNMTKAELLMLQGAGDIYEIIPATDK